MKKYILFLLPLLVTACLDPEPPQPKPEGILVTSNITENTTWYSDSIYVLNGRISVTNGAELTIQPGCIIKGGSGSGASATALVIARGAKLYAMGTPNAPIIFTSIADSIQPGMIASPNLTYEMRGLWGGLIILGNAPISATAETIQIEGIPTSDPNGLYGGENTHDNSGVLSHISIRHGGANIGSGNEINGLTLGGVGLGTSVNNIEVVANQDDGIEVFGGHVNLAYVVSWNVGDDGFDTDQSWAGSLNDFVIINPAGHCFELDGPEGTYEAGHLIQNGDIYVGNGQDLINVDQNSIVDLFNLYFTDIQGIHQINRTTAPGVTFGNIVLDVDNNSIGNYINGTLPQSVVVGGQIPKANTSTLGWTWAAQAGKF